MKLPLQKIMAEKNIKRIKKQLEDLDALDAKATLKPIDQPNETYLVVTHEDQRKKLLKELAKYEKVVKGS